MNTYAGFWKDNEKDMMKSSWRNKEAAHHVEIELELWVATEEVCSLAQNPSSDF